MISHKERIRTLLRATGLYGFAWSVWSRRPDLKALCWNAGYRLVGAPDGLPLPPTHLIYLVANSREIAWFLHGGRLTKQAILHALQRNGFSLANFEAVLDFGCGCGRVMRWWRAVSGPRFYGTDYNPELVRWCQQHLGQLAQYSHNCLAPPLDYANGQFDFIYAVSVFTHLTEELQFSWLAELQRVLKVDGLLLMTLHGASRLDQLAPAEQHAFLAGQLVVKTPEAAGSNVCGAYHPQRYVREKLARGFRLLDFIEVGVPDAGQDIYLLAKPAA